MNYAKRREYWILEIFLSRISPIGSCLQRWKELTEAQGEFRDQVAECQTEKDRESEGNA